MEKGILIDFTKKGNFKVFNNSVKNFIKKNKNKKILKIIDYIYPIANLKYNKYEISDHINLSGENPLQGPCFISLTNIYVSNSKNPLIVAGLKRENHPNKKEKEILLKNKVKAYCHNLIPTTIFAASYGLKIKAIGLTKLS